MNNWYNTLNKSNYTPPSYVFSIVWSILYVLIITSFLIIITTKKCNIYCLLPFIIQFIINISWTYVFFDLKKINLSLLLIMLIIILTIISYNNFYKINKISAYLLLPYLVWLIIALYLNSYIVFNN